MISSIFSSEKMNGVRAMALLLATMLFYYCALEIAMRTFVPQMNRIQRQQGENYRSAVALRPVTVEGAITVLVVGNSLLRAGVDGRKLGQAMAPSYSVSVFPVDFSAYWDWYFGLRRLFAEGARPAVIALCLTPEQLISDSTNGERFARTMMQTTDLWPVARVSRLDTTTTSDYFFAHWSSWLGGRWHIRNWILAQWVPDAADLIQRFVPRKQSVQLPASVVAERAVVRLRKMRELAHAYGARFILFMPPSVNVTDPAIYVQMAAAQADIPVLLPYRPGEMPSDLFPDGSHLNAKGAELFTERLWPALYHAVELPEKADSPTNRASMPVSR